MRIRKKRLQSNIHFDIITEAPLAVHAGVPSVQRRNFLYAFFSMRVVYIFFVFFLIFFLAIGARLFYVQILKHTYFFSLAESNRVRTRSIPAERGKIYDRNKIPLVENIPSFSLNLVPREFSYDAPEFDNHIAKLSTVLDIPTQELEEIIRQYAQYHYEEISLKESMTFEQALKLEILTAEIPGIRIGKEFSRQYIHPGVEANGTRAPSSFSHIIGYTGKLTRDELNQLGNAGYGPADIIGKTGIEYTYEAFLRGTYGKKISEVDAAGNEQAVLAVEQPVPGQHVLLTIDSQVQSKLESILATELLAQNKKRGSGIIMDPRNGAILALVSLPAYDNNMFTNGITTKDYEQLINNPDQPLFFRAIAGMYPSGSIIKPIIAVAALDAHIITPATTFQSAGGIQVSQWFFPDWKAGGHGPTNVVKALSESVNTFFYIVGGGYKDFLGLGPEAIRRSLSMFGLGVETGVELPGEAPGFIPSIEWKKIQKGEEWYIGDTYNFSIGQGDLLITPLQAASYTAALANDGILYRPQIIYMVFDPETETEQFVEPQVVRDGLANPGTLRTVQRGMRACVETGSCRGLLPFTAAAKTGTAQWSSTKNNHAWVVGYYPYQEPELVFVVMVEEGGEGSASAVPVARQFLQWWSQTH